MMMKMLEAGGLQLVTDGVRRADDSNPQGYYEFQRVKQLDKPSDTAWLADARGKAVKIISFLLTHLPEAYDYRVLFMQRDLDEVISSQNRMLEGRGASRGIRDDHTRSLYMQHLEQVEHFLAKRPCFSTLRIGYEETITSPRQQAARINAFLGGALDEGKMATVVDATLYRSRGAPGQGPVVR